MRSPEDRRYRRMGGSRFVDMAISREEREEAEAVAPPPFGGDREYPYGLCIALENTELDKLGAEGRDFRVGDLLDLRAMAKVTNISQHESEGHTHCRIELQITHLALENESAEQPGEAA